MGSETNYGAFPEDTETLPIQITAEDGVMSRGTIFRRKGTRPKIGVHLMHPRGDSAPSYHIAALVRAGYSVLARFSRWPNNDIGTVHEVLLLDVAAGIKYLRDDSCENVVLLGVSGGAPLAALYQAQASAPTGGRLTHTPGGDAFDLNRFTLPLADGLAYVAGHGGQAVVMGNVIDPAVVDEEDPLATDSELDLFNPQNGYEIPPKSSTYSPEFLIRYRGAQLARVRRLDEKARSFLARQRESKALLEGLGASASLAQVRAAKFESHMIIYRTSADPAFIDMSIEPDDRSVGSFHSKRPDFDNYANGGFARCATPRAWLSSWSPLSTNASSIDNLPRLTTPLLMVHHAADVSIRMSEAKALFNAAASPDKTFHIVRHADHYGFLLKPDGSQGARAWEGTEHLLTWIKARFER